MTIPPVLLFNLFTSNVDAGGAMMPPMDCSVSSFFVDNCGFEAVHFHTREGILRPLPRF